jgi:nitrogenase molybdenum-iron protein alpha/beta subunit
MTRLFDMIGIRINTTFLSCTVDAIRRAPAAELNIVGWRGTMWAELMNKRFGTDYIRGSSSYSTYSALEGAERFFFDVAGKFDLDGVAEEVIRKVKMRALEEVDRYAKLFKDHDFALFPPGFLYSRITTSPSSHLDSSSIRIRSRPTYLISISL